MKLVLPSFNFIRDINNLTSKRIIEEFTTDSLPSDEYLNTTLNPHLWYMVTSWYVVKYNI